MTVKSEVAGAATVRSGVAGAATVRSWVAGAARAAPLSDFLTTYSCVHFHCLVSTIASAIFMGGKVGIVM